jgi:hypothetical protein
MMSEIWRKLPISGRHEVSNMGRVRSWINPGRGAKELEEPRLLKCGKNAGGYVRVTIEKRQYFVHQLVLEAFIGPRPAGKEACHKDGNKSNNRSTNLRWDTKKANAEDSIRHGVFPFLKGKNRVMPGESNPNAKLTQDQVDEIRRICKTGKISQSKLAKQFKVSRALISHIISGRSWK